MTFFKCELFHLSLWYGVNFINVLRTAFTPIGPKSAKRHCWLDCLFCAFGIYVCKSCTWNIDEIEPSLIELIARFCLWIVDVLTLIDLLRCNTIPSNFFSHSYWGSYSNHFYPWKQQHEHARLNEYVTHSGVPKCHRLSSHTTWHFLF